MPALGKDASDLHGGGDSLPHLLSVARANLQTSGSPQPGLTSLSGQPLTLPGPALFQATSWPQSQLVPVPPPGLARAAPSSPTASEGL